MSNKEDYTITVEHVVFAYFQLMVALTLLPTLTPLASRTSCFRVQAQQDEYASYTCSLLGKRYTPDLFSDTLSLTHTNTLPPLLTLGLATWRASFSLSKSRRRWCKTCVSAWWRKRTGFQSKVRLLLAFVPNADRTFSSRFSHSVFFSQRRPRRRSYARKASRRSSSVNENEKVVVKKVCKIVRTAL
jgi:hypothetical protein